jgi:hypothetical protein
VIMEGKACDRSGGHSADLYTPWATAARLAGDSGCRKCRKNQHLGLRPAAWFGC